MRKLLSVLFSTLQGGVRGGLLFVAIFSTSTLWAYDFQSGDLYYNITSSSEPYTVEVTYQKMGILAIGNNYIGLTTATIPETITYNGTTYSVTGIGDNAFNWSPVTSVTIPNSVTSIGAEAFLNCIPLTSVTIGESVTSIGAEAFLNCISLTSVTIPNSVTSIGGSAFGYCSSLTSITIPNSVTSIGDEAFKNCIFTKDNFINHSTLDAETNNYWGAIIVDSEIDGLLIRNDTVIDCRHSLTSVTIPNSVTSIGAEAFSGCSSLTSVTIGESVTSIGERAFSNCSVLESIVWNAKNCADASSSWTAPFYGITSQIKSFTFGETVEHIPAYLCCGMDKLTSVTIPNSVTSIGDDAFSGCSSLPIENNLRYADTYLVGAVNETLSTYSIKEGTKWVGEWAFYRCSSLTSITIPNSVTSIGDDAFRNCSSLTSVTIGESVTSIGDDAFYSCSALESIVWNAKNYADASSLQDAPFYELSSQIKSFTFGDAVEYVPAYLCWGMDKLTSVTIPNSVTSIGNYAFYECSSLTSLTIGESVTSIDLQAFSSCSSLTSLTIGESVTSIGNYAFRDCSVLESIVWNAKNCADASSLETAPFYGITSQIKSFTFGETVEHIPAYLCYGMDKLTSVTIPNSVTSIGERAFSNCSVLESIVWNAKNCADASSLETAPFYGITSQIKSFTFGETVEYIPAYLCYGIEKLTSVTTPNSLKTIGTSAFEGCVRLGKISLGTGLAEIAANAFAGCTRLYDIYVYATYPPFAEESSFANYNVYVYIPCEYQRDYTLDVVWGNFKFIECIESEDVTTDGVIITPSTNDVTITWPTEDNAENYTIVIEKDGEVFCTLTFNADGQLLNIAFAPSRDGNNRPVQYAEQAVNGYRFTVTGLEEGTHYAYNIDVKDAADKTIKSYTGEFTTESTTAVENTHSPSPIINCQKIIRDGQLYIYHNDKTYNTVGQIVE